MISQKGWKLSVKQNPQPHLKLFCYSCQSFVSKAYGRKADSLGYWLKRHICSIVYQKHRIQINKQVQVHDCIQLPVS